MEEKLSGLTDVILEMGNIIMIHLMRQKILQLKLRMAGFHLKRWNRMLQRSERVHKEMTNIVGIINEISISNTEGAEELHLDSEELFHQMNSFQNTIDEYKG